MLRRAISRAEEPPEMEKRSNPLEPLAKWTQEGTLVWNERLVDAIKKLAGDP